jgi:hypothetical protein
MPSVIELTRSNFQINNFGLNFDFGGNTFTASFLDDNLNYISDSLITGSNSGTKSLAVKIVASGYNASANFGKGQAWIMGLPPPQLFGNNLRIGIAVKIRLDYISSPNSIKAGVIWGLANPVPLLVPASLDNFTTINNGFSALISYKSSPQLTKSFEIWFPSSDTPRIKLNLTNDNFYQILIRHSGFMGYNLYEFTTSNSKNLIYMGNILGGNSPGYAGFFYMVDCKQGNDLNVDATVNLDYFIFEEYVEA